MSRTSRAMTRAIAAASVLALVGLVAPTPAAGATALLPKAAPGEMHDLSVSFTFGPKAMVTKHGAMPRVHTSDISNHGPVNAIVTFDLSKLSADIAAEIAPQDADDERLDCTRKDALVTCVIDPQISLRDARFLRLVSSEDAKPGPAGKITATIEGDFDEEEVNPADNVATLLVYVPEHGPDLATWIGSRPDLAIGPGDTKTLSASVRNDGDEPIDSYLVTYRMPRGVRLFGYLNDTCVMSGKWVTNAPNGYAYGPTQVRCRVNRLLRPGEEHRLTDPGSGPYPAYSIAIGKNLPGPGDVLGHIEGYTYPDTDRQNDVFDMRYLSKPNKLDLAVAATPVSGEVGDIVTVKYTVSNKGPSDGTGPRVDIVAPPGTVLLPATGCWTKDSPNQQREPESAALRCGSEAYFPATASGAGVLTATVRLKIKSTPSGNGSITAANLGESAESNPANNTAALAIAAGGAGGGGLPITGASVRAIAGLGAAAIVVGVTLLLIARRRRTTR